MEFHDNTADHPSFLSHLLCRLPVFVPPLQHSASSFLSSFSASPFDSFLVYSFYTIHKQPYLLSRYQLPQVYIPVPDVGLSSRFNHFITVDECPSGAYFRPPHAPFLAIIWPGEWMTLTLTTAERYIYKELIQN